MLLFLFHYHYYFIVIIIIIITIIIINYLLFLSSLLLSGFIVKYSCLVVDGSFIVKGFVFSGGRCLMTARSAHS